MNGTVSTRVCIDTRKKMAPLFRGGRLGELLLLRNATCVACERYQDGLCEEFRQLSEGFPRC